MINLVSVVPYLGDTTKLAKIPKYLGTLGAIAILAGKHADVAKKIEPILERIVKTFNDVPWNCLPESVAKQLTELKKAAEDALDQVRKALGKGFPKINKAVNSDIVHAAERAVERGVFPDKKSAADALRELSKKITSDGLPPGTIPDPRRADSVLVPFGNGRAVYEINANGTAILRTVLGAN